MKNSAEGRSLRPALRRVLDVLTDQPDLVDVDAVARHLGKHTNTVREHLTALVDAGFAERFAAPAEGRGRPAWLYGAVRRGKDPEHAELAASLAWRISQKESDPVDAAQHAGRQWGRIVATERGLAVRDSSDQVRAEVVEILDEMGYHPQSETDPDLVTLRRCPLLQMANVIPDVVCALHIGMTQHIVGELGEDPGSVSLEPFAGPERCELRFGEARPA